MNFFMLSVVVWTVVATWMVQRVLMTTVTRQSMMLDWLNVGTDSDHSTVKVNVNVNVDN